MPRRPLFISHTGVPGGSNRVVLDLLRYAPEGSAPTCVFLAPGSAVDEAQELGVPVDVLRSGRASQLWRAPSLVAALRRVIRKTLPDIVFAHATKAHAYASLAARLEGVPYLWWQHDPPQLRPVSKWIAAKLPAEAVICSSDFSAARQRQLGTRASVVRIHCGTEVSGALKRRAHNAGGDPLVATVGALRPYKRQDLLLRAAPLVLAQRPDVRFRVLGGVEPGADPAYPAVLRSLVESLNGGAELAGHQNDVPEQLLNFDVVVHCADQEPFGLAVVEAMLRGVPVVCPPTGGPSEIVRHGVDGIHVDVTDSAALADAILRLLNDADLRESMGRAASERVLGYFSAGRMADETWALLERVAKGRG